MTWEHIGNITARIVKDLEPRVFTVSIRHGIAARLEELAALHKASPETIIAELVSEYLGDAA